MEFGIGRSHLLSVLGQAMLVETASAGAFLGRFQHLQRLRLVEGINPGRGRQAAYRANQVMVIALAMQLLQLGLSPERAVRIIKENKERVRLSISLAVTSAERLAPAFLYFDPALLTALGAEGDHADHAEQTFHYAGQGTLRDMIEGFLVEGDVPRMAIVNVKGTIVAIKDAMWNDELMRDQAAASKSEEGTMAPAFHHALYEWVSQSDPDSLE